MNKNVSNLLKEKKKKVSQKREKEKYLFIK